MRLAATLLLASTLLPGCVFFVPVPALAFPYVGGTLPSDADLTKLREGMALEQVAEILGPGPYRWRKGDRVVWGYAALPSNMEDEPAVDTINSVEITFVDGNLVEWPGHAAR